MFDTEISNFCAGQSRTRVYGETNPTSDRQIPVFFGRQAFFFGGQHCKAGRQPGAGESGLYDIINIAPGRGDVRVGELIPVFIDFFPPCGLRVRGGLNLLFKNNIRGPIRTHDGNLGARPGQNGIGPQFLVAHPDIGAPISLPDN